MFTQTFIDGVQDTKKKYTVAISLFLQIAALGVLVVIPLLYTEVLPGAQLRSFLLAPTPPQPPAVPLIKEAVTATRTVVHQFSVKILTAPRVIPKTVASISEAAPDVGVTGSTGEPGVSGGVPLGVIASAPESYSPPPPSQPKPPAGPLRIGGGVAEAKLVHKVQPVYPPLARSARIQGTVEFTATISKDGLIENLQLSHGHPLLVNAAREAVLQWRYKPTLLNGLPVEVVTDIVVNFTLSQ